MHTHFLYIVQYAFNKYADMFIYNWNCASDRPPVERKRTFPLFAFDSQRTFSDFKLSPRHQFCINLNKFLIEYVSWRLLHLYKISRQSLKNSLKYSVLKFYKKCPSRVRASVRKSALNTGHDGWVIIIYVVFTSKYVSLVAQRKSVGLEL